MLLLLNSTKEELILAILLSVMKLASTLDSGLVDTEVSKVIMVAITLTNTLVVVTLVLHLRVFWGQLMLLVFLLLHLER